MRSLVPASLLALLALSLPLAPREARADAPAAPLARLLGRPGHRHPLADDSGRISVLVPLPRGRDARSLGLVPVAPGIGAARLLPEEIAAYDGGLSLFTGPPRQPLLDVSAKLTRVESYRNTTGMTGQGVIVGIVDTSFDVTHPDLRDAEGKTRIRWMLQAAKQSYGPHTELEYEYGCRALDEGGNEETNCTILAADEIDAMIAAGEVGLLQDRNGHGTHVASIAAGNGGPMAGETRYIGVAPEATLIVVAPSSGAGFDDADLLNATRFIFDRAAELGLPAVVNLSVGGDFGPHDGTSLLEKGLAAMVGDDKPGRAIVVAAGNSGTVYDVGDEGPLGIHTEARVPPHATVRVPIRAPAAQSGEGYVWITFRSGDEVSVGLEAPDGSTWVGMTAPGEDGGYVSDDEKTVASVINRLAKSGSPLTTDTNGAVLAWKGDWEEGKFNIVLEGQGDAQLWVVGLGDAGPSRDDPGLLFERAMKQGTITVPASHPSLLAVGCTVNRIRWTPVGSNSAIQISEIGGEPPESDTLCYFSSAGPTPFGVPKPDLVAPGGFVAAAMSAGADPRTEGGGLFASADCPDGESCLVVDDHHAITAGTSMSSPHVAGAVALLFQRNPNLTQAQVTEILQAGARYPKGTVRHEAQLGPGALDIEGAIQAMDIEPEMGEDPAIEQSWYVLSSSYARPDPSWPVWGTIELRRQDGALASGLSGDKLEVQVTNGSLVEPLAKVRHGMWRFAVAAPRGAYDTTLVVEVFYDGVSMGRRELPVGTDVWMANGDASATSAGCACAAAGSDPAPSRALALAALGVASLAARRRRRSAR